MFICGWLIVVAGWFSVVTERGQVKARCYSSVHRLVSAQVTAFLTMSDVVGYTLNNRTSAGKFANKKVLKYTVCISKPFCQYNYIS